IVLGPLLSSIERNPEPELGPDKQEVLVDRVLLDYVRIPAYRAVSADDGRPGAAKVDGLVYVRPHIAEIVQVKGCVGRAFVKMAGVNGRDPGAFGETLNIADDVVPLLAAV